MQTELDRLCALARTLADSLTSLSDEVADPAEWHVRIAAGQARAIEDLLSRPAGAAPRGAVEAKGPWHQSPEGDPTSFGSLCRLPR